MVDLAEVHQNKDNKVPLQINKEQLTFYLFLNHGHASNEIVSILQFVIGNVCG